MGWNLIGNTDFEGGRTTGWISQGANPGNKTVTVDNANPYFGSCSLKVTTSTAGGDWWLGGPNTYHFKAGVTYTISGWIKTNNSRTVAIGLYDGVSESLSNFSSTASWQKFTVTRLISASSTYVQPMIRDNNAAVNNSLWIDGIKVEYGSSASEYSPARNFLDDGTMVTTPGGSLRIGWDNATSNPGPTFIMAPSPTGTAVTDRANIQAAINQAALNGGGTVALQKGTYALEQNSTNGYCIRIYQGVRLIGAGPYATILNAASSACNVIDTDPATWDGQKWICKYGICIKDLQVLAGANSGTHIGVYINGAIGCFLENVFVNGNYNNGNPGTKFATGICVKAWTGTIVNCYVQECYLGYDLSWDEDLGGNPRDWTNAVEMIGCHFQGTILPPPSGGTLIGCSISGFSNCLTGCCFERFMTSAEYPPTQTLGIWIKDGGCNTIEGCYFEGWNNTYELDGCKGTNILGGVHTAYGNPAIVYANGADTLSYSNSVQNVWESVYWYSAGLWRYLSGSAVGKTLLVDLCAGGSVGIGTSGPVCQVHVMGSGQTTAAFSDAGSTGSALFLHDNSQQAGSGGALLIGGEGGNKWFAAIKGLLTDGNANSIGDLAISLRNATSDTALTQRVMIKSGGNVGIGCTNPGDKLSVNNKVLITDASSSGSITVPTGGVTIFWDGTNLKAKRASDGKVSTLSPSWS